MYSFSLEESIFATITCPFLMRLLIFATQPICLRGRTRSIAPLQNPFHREATSTALHCRLHLRLMPAQGRNSHDHRDDRQDNDERAGAVGFKMTPLRIHHPTEQGT